MSEALSKSLLTPFWSPNLQMVGWLSYQIPVTQWQAVGCLFYHRFLPHLLNSYVSLTSLGADWEREALAWRCFFHIMSSPPPPCPRHSLTWMRQQVVQEMWALEGRKHHPVSTATLQGSEEVFSVTLDSAFSKYQTISHTLPVISTANFSPNQYKTVNDWQQLYVYFS